MSLKIANILTHNIAVIFGCFVTLCIVSLVIAYQKAKTIEKKTDSTSEKAFQKDNYYWVSISYTCFTVLISIFPLLGMLGTVVSLISLDLSGEVASMQENFFHALDTTMWGIIFAVIFKIVNACVQPYIEAQEEKARQLLEKKYF